MDVRRHIATPANSTTDNCVDNENTEKAENIAEPENVAVKKGSENANVPAEYMLNAGVCLKRRKSDREDSAQDDDGIFKRLRSKERLQIMHRKRGQKIQAQKTENSPRKSKRLRSEERLQMVALKEGSENTRTKEGDDEKTEEIAIEGETANFVPKEGTENASAKEGDVEKIEEIAIRGETANIVPKEGTENASRKEDDEKTEEIAIEGETPNVVPKEGTENASAKEGDVEKIEEIAIRGETANIVPKEGTENASTKEGNNFLAMTHNENSGEIEKSGETENGGQIEGSEKASTAEKPQVTRGTDNWTSTNEDDFMQSEEELCVPSRASFDYSLLPSNTWHEVSIQRSTTTQPFSVFQESIINVYNAESKLDESSILNKVRVRLAGKELFYHGTTTDSAKRIIEEGIKVTMSNRCVDFSYGKGFYLTNDYDRALHWSKRKAKRECSYGAVIAFKMDRSRNERHLSLTLDNDTNKKFWECIVSHFRHGKTSPDVESVLRSVKYIEGPVSRIRGNLKPGEIPTPLDSGLFHQLCICDQGYANRFGHLENILCFIRVAYK